MAITHFGNKMLRGTKGDRVVDSLGSSADGTTSGITLVESPFLGSGLQLNGSSGGSTNRVYWGTVNNFKYLHDDTTDWSINFWTTFTNTSDVQNIFTNMGSSISNTGFQLLFDPAGNGNNAIRVRLGNGTSSARANWTTNNDFIPAFDTRYMITITYDATSNVITIYRDGGNSQNSGALTNAVSTSNPSGQLRLGSDNEDSTVWRMKGKFNQLLFYKKKLSTSEISALYNSGNGDTTPDTGNLYGWYKFDGNGTDEQGNNSNVTVDTGVDYLSSPKLGSGNYSFDGSNDYVSIDDSSANLIQGRSSAWTIAGWLKRDGSTDKYFISQWGKNTSPDNRVFHIGIDSTGKLLYRQRTDGGQGESFTSNGAITDNTWTHFAIVWQPNGSNWQAQMYINGTADNSKTDFANDMRGGSITEPIYLGKNGSDATAPSAGGDYFNGELDDLAVWHRALSATEIGKLANNNDPPFTHTGDQNSYGTTSIANNSLVLDSNSGSTQTASPVAVKDLGTLGSSWCVRWSVYAPTQSESISGKNSFARFGFSDKGTYSSSEGLNVVTDKAILWNWHLGTSLLKNMTYTGGSGTNNGGQSISYADDTTWYWEMKYDGSTVTITRYNSDYSSAQATADTISVSGYTGMNYLVIGQPRDHNNGIWELRFDNIKVWNNQSSATGDPDFTFEFNNNTDGGDAQLVSSLTDKSNLKAYYSMNSTELTTAPSSADWSEDFSTGSASHSSDGQTLNGWYANNHTRSYFDGSNNYGAISMHSSTNTALSFDLEQSGNGGLGTSINATNWTLRFRWHIISKASDHTNGTQGFIGLANTAGGSPSAIDGMGMSMVQAVSSGDKVMNAISDNSNPMNYGGSGTSDRHIALEVSNGDDYWIQITRDGDTEILSIYSDSNYSTLVSSNSKTVSGVTGLRYFLAQAQNDSSAGYTTMYVDDIKFYDGVSIKDGLKNDYSSTSDLDAMTNLPENTIFFQTDDTPKYFWKQSDNTWKIDGTTAFLPSGSGLHVGGSSSNTSTFTATDYVWASSSVSTIGESRSYSSGAGNKNSFWIAGGSNAHTSRIFDGSSWSSTTALDTERRDTTAGGGSTSNAIIACGRNQAGTEISTSTKYNGTAWSSAGTVTGGAGEHVGGAGTGSSFLATGGSTRNDKCDKYDGTSWSASAVLPQTTVRSHNQAGKSSASAHTAGGNYASSFTWNGTSWATSTNYTQGGDTTVRYPTGGGTAEHHWIMGGLDETGGTSTLNNTELWNGSTWTAKGALPTANYAGLGDGSDF